MARKTLRRTIESLKHGERIYINAINLTPEEISLLRQFIKRGHVAPDRKEVEKHIIPEYVNEYMTGNIIAPQMVYIGL